jgi:CheY-like chemotaxis protein
MGGEISVASVYGKGSTFTAVLPQKILDARPIAGNISTGENNPSEQPDAEIIFTAPNARILIVDDVSINLLVAEGLLAPYKMQIDCCTSGAEALSLIEKNRYDLILMDHMMPEMNGVETTTRIRTLEEKKRKENLSSPKGVGAVYRPTPIVALTADAIVGMKEMFLENGFNDFISKPIEISSMNAIIKKWVPREKQISIG